jgi:hypothetical protein
MTPSAMTAAGRSAAAPRPADAPAAPGRRRAPRPVQAPRAPRRVSGPGRGGRAATAPALRPSSLAARGLHVIRGLPEHTLLDRIVRGRAWIPLLGVLLVGIVGMQVEILKLGTGLGRWLERGSTLSNRNQELQANVAALMDDQRLERLAAKMGMVMPDPTAVSFLTAQPGAAARAAAAIHAPDPTNFLAQASVAAPLSASAGSGTPVGSSGSSAATIASPSSQSGTASGG